MGRKRAHPDAAPARKEKGAIYKNWQGRLRVCLAYPNTYRVGMSNLGFQTVYRLLNEMEAVVCERAFLPDSTGGAGRIVSQESGRPLGEFDLIAFSVSFENDYVHVLDILDRAGLPLQAELRGPPHPLVLAGGVACFLNPEPLAPFADGILVGEAEPLLERFVAACLDLDAAHTPQRIETLARIAREVPGFYAPACYRPRYRPDGTLAAFEPTADVPTSVVRRFLPDLTRSDTCSAILSQDTAFEGAYLIEVSRGCPHGCRFCSAGYIYRPPRFRPLEQLAAGIEKGAALTDRVGLVGAAVSDLPGLQSLCETSLASGLRISFSSLRADALSAGLADTLRGSRVKTATIAPEAGSQRLRDVINKGISEQDVLTAAVTLVSAGIPNLRLYFMIGLPTEADDDIEAIVTLCRQVREVFLDASRPRGRIGHITVGVSSFVPKASTPFQWAAMDDSATLKRKIIRIKNGLRQTPNLKVHADPPRISYVQGLLARGDRRAADFLAAAHANGANWAKTLRAAALNPDFFALRQRPLDECLPWDFIETGVKKSFLASEYRRALQGRPSPACPVVACSRCGICRDPGHDDRTGPGASQNLSGSSMPVPEK